MTFKTSQFCDDPQKYPQNFIHPKTFIFLKTSQILKSKILNPPPPPHKKNGLSLHIYENIRDPPPLGIKHQFPHCLYMYAKEWNPAKLGRNVVLESIQCDKINLKYNLNYDQSTFQASVIFQLLFMPYHFRQSVCQKSRLVKSM